MPDGSPTADGPITVELCDPMASYSPGRRTRPAS